MGVCAVPDQNPRGGWILSLLPVARIPPATPWSSEHLCSPWAFSVMGFLTVGGGHAIQSDPSDYKHVMPYIEGREPFYTTSRDSSSRYPLKLFQSPRNASSSGEAEADPTCPRSLFKPEMTLPAALPSPTLGPLLGSSMLLMRHGQLCPCPGHLLGGFYPVL